MCSVTKLQKEAVLLSFASIFRWDREDLGGGVIVA